LLCDGLCPCALDFPVSDMTDNARTIGTAGGDSSDFDVFDELLPALAQGLDVREFFRRLCAVASRIVPHDDASLVLRTDDPPVVDLTEPTLLDDGPADARGLRSSLAVPVRIGDQFFGVFTLRSRRPHAYAPRDLEHAQRLSRIIALAISHQQLAERARDAAFEQRRAANIEASAELLRTIADVLDIRSVFPRVSEIANKMLPHDAMAMVFYDPDGKIAVQAASTPDFPDLQHPQVARSPLAGDSLFGDLTTDRMPIASGPNPADRLVAAGYRSAIGVSTRARDQIMSVGFLSKRRHAFHQRDFPVARRIADYIVLAVSHEQLADAARQVAEARARADHLAARVQMLAEELDSKTQARVIGQSAEWLDVLKKATQVAATDTTVLVSGDSGTGKEVVARFIHRASGRGNGPFVALNCAALPEQLLESELFGYERGAFTSAQQSKPGQIELAAGGVLFLDEVSEMSLSSQAKFLRVLQEREFQRLGSTRLLKANIRVIAATNRDLRKAVERGDFREDLFYRLQVFDIHIPPLRERRSDVLPLGEAFLKDIGKSFGRPPAGLTPRAREALLAYAWPGNVRELHNALERRHPRRRRIDRRTPSRAAGRAQHIAAHNQSHRGGAGDDREGVARDPLEQGPGGTAPRPVTYSALRADAEVRNQRAAADRLGWSPAETAALQPGIDPVCAGAPQPSVGLHEGIDFRIRQVEPHVVAHGRECLLWCAEKARPQLFVRQNLSDDELNRLVGHEWLAFWQRALLIPAAAERAIDLHEREPLVQSRLRETELCREQARLAVEHFEIARRAALIPSRGQTLRIVCRTEQELLLLPEFAALAIGDQGVRDVTERLLDGLLIHQHHLFASCFGHRDLRLHPAAVEDRLEQPRADREHPRGTCEQV